MVLLNLTKMNKEQRIYIQTDRNQEGDIYCSGDGFSFMFTFPLEAIIDFETVIREFYLSLRNKLKLYFKSIEVVNFDAIKNEADFLNKKFKREINGSVFFEFDIPMYWFNGASDHISELVLPRGIRMSIYKNDKLADALNLTIGVNFNLFSNNLVSIQTRGTSTPELYYFRPAARINRAIFRSAMVELCINNPLSRLDFFSNIGRLQNFDKYGFNENTDFVFD